MQKESMSVGFSCALGILIGATSALEIQSRFTYGEWLWIFGALFGGIVAYVSVQFKDFISGVQRSYQVSKQNVKQRLHAMTSWRLNVEYLEIYAITASTIFVIITYLMLAIAGLNFLESGKISFPPIVPMFLFSVFLSLGLSSAWASSLAAYRHTDNRKKFNLITFKLNPVSLPFFLLIELWQKRATVYFGAVVTLMILVGTVTIVSREFIAFLKRTFVYIHSEERMICLVDTIIGAAVGYYLGSVILVALLGMVFGMMQYELVSVRWLRLVPIKK